MKTTRTQKQKSQTPVGLLNGQPYIPAAKTDIVRSFKRMGWVPPSEAREVAAQGGSYAGK